MYKRKKWAILTAVCACLALGAGMASVSAVAEQSLSGFEISAVSVRVSDEMQNGKNTSGIRFKTDVGANAKETYKDAFCYTTLTVDSKDVSRKVAAQVWRAENDGWNTVVMGIPKSDYSTKITAQSFIEVNSSTVYATQAVSYSISDAAQLVVQDQNASADLKKGVQKYIWGEETYSYTFSDYKAGAQYAKEEHALDENVTIATDTCHFTTQLRIYQSDTNNGIAILSTKKGVISALQMNAGYKTSVLNVYGSTDGNDWKLIKGVSVVETYKDYTVDIDESKGYTYLKFDAVSKQVRLQSLGITLCGYGLNYDGSIDDGDQGGSNNEQPGGNQGGSNNEQPGGNQGGSGNGTMSGTGSHSVGANGKCTVCGEQLITYNTSGTYLANWGTRDETATFLTPYANAFYTGNYTYEALSKLSGGTSQSNASSSALYSTLKTLMSSKHTTTTSYDATKQMYRYTDCINNDTAHISSFYSGKQLTGNWDSAATWNREHTWPKSKSLNGSSNGGSDEADIMMLRPTWVQENSSRGNTAYGQSSGYYDPNGEGSNVRGDCARIVLYVYVRWGNTQYMWGQSGVMESMDVLLKWMAEDPVDTWEMGRNDVVEDITGTRNVFVDYPELAWQLFGKSVPAGLATPSTAKACSSGVAPVQIYFPNLKDDGDCTLIKVGDTEVLVDAGATRGSAATVVPYLKQYCTDGVLEYVIATHAHEDHIAAFVGNNGADGVFNNFDCRTIIDFPNANSTSGIYTAYKTWRDKEVTAGAVHYTALDCWNNANGAKRSYELGAGVTMHILYQKYYAEKASSENNHSVCMMISQGDNHYLFTGDLESAGEASLVASNTLPKMAFYKAGHHGSDTSSSTTLMSVIQPKVVVATCVAGGASYNFPKQDFINNVAKYTDRVYIPSYLSGGSILDLNGDICVASTDGKNVQVSCSNHTTILKDTTWFKNSKLTWAA